MARKAEQFGAESMAQIEKQVLLQQIDAKWREHLVTLEHLRSVVGFRGYAQRDPLSEYKTEAFQLFEGLLDGLRGDVTQNLARIRPLTDAEREEVMEAALAHVAGRVPVIVTTTHYSTQICIERSQLAQSLDDYYRESEGPPGVWIGAWPKLRRTGEV